MVFYSSRRSCYFGIGDDEYTIKKKKISFISYNKVRKKLYIRLKNTCIENIYMSEEEYIRIKDSLES